MNTEKHLSQIAQIERYLLGEMEGEELEMFKQRLEQDPELQKEVQKYRFLIEQLDKLRLRKKIEKAVRNSGQSPKNFLSVPLKFWLIAASLILCTGIFVYRLFLTPTNPPIAIHIGTQQTTADTGELLIPNTDSENSPIAFIKASDSTDQTTPQTNTEQTTTSKTNPKDILKPTDILKPIQNNPKENLPLREQLASNNGTGENMHETNIRAIPDSKRAEFLNEFYRYPKEEGTLNLWQEEYKEYVQKHPTTIQNDTVLTLIEQLFRQRKMSDYKLKLKNLSNADPNNFAIKYYLAHSYLTDLEPEKALPYLEEICNAKSIFSFTSNAQWNRAFCYTFTNPVKAKALLTDLSQNFKHPYSAQAHKLLGRLYAPKN